MQSEYGGTVTPSPATCAVVLYLLAVSSPATAQPPVEAKSDGFGAEWSELLPDFMNATSLEEIRAVVANGIGSDDPNTVERTLRQIGVIGFLGTIEDLRSNIPDDFSEPHPRFEPLRRQFSTIPGLRDRLMESIRKGPDLDKNWTPAEAEPAFMSETELRQLAQWGFVEQALVAYFPQDPVVHDFLIDWWRRGDPAYRVPVLLYTGRFRSDAAEEIYIASLGAPGPVGVVAAAKGLALCGSDTGLDALVTNLDRRDSTLETIVEAIATYGMRVRPHLGSLIELGEELEAYDTDDNDPFALDAWRKQTIIRTLTRLSTQFETADGD